MTPVALAVGGLWALSKSDQLTAVARTWFRRMRACGADVQELMHDGCPVVCVEDAPFAYVNVFKSHTNVGFFYGAYLHDPAGLLEGTGKKHASRETQTRTRAQRCNTREFDQRRISGCEDAAAGPVRRRTVRQSD